MSRAGIKSQLAALSKRQLVAALLIILSMLLPELRTGKIRKSLAITESIAASRKKPKHKMSAAQKKGLLKAIANNKSMTAEAKRKARKTLEGR